MRQSEDILANIILGISTNQSKKRDKLSCARQEGMNEIFRGASTMANTHKRMRKKLNLFFR
jgi:hypothetical protein